MITFSVNDRGDIQLSEESRAPSVLDANERGYLSHVIVSMADGSRYPVFFIEPVRLQQELEQSCRLGRHVFVEVGLVVVPRLDLDTLKAAIGELIERGYFRFLRTIDEVPNPWDV